MKNILVTMGIVIVFIIGLSIMLYPTVASYINSLRQSRVVSQYYRDIENLTLEQFEEILSAAHEYNERLRTTPDRFTFSPDDKKEYLSLLDPVGKGMMGTLYIEKIKVRLPIYHGTSEEVLQRGTGHFEGTSLPVGGPGTHSVVTGHRGLPSSIMLTDLDQLEEGDTFTMIILNEILTYKVDRILVVEPHELWPLTIEDDEDYCTLLTCTPYAINSHRLLVRGSRIANEDADFRTPAFLPDADADAIKPIHVAMLLLIPVLVINLVILIVRLVKELKKRDCGSSPQ